MVRSRLLLALVVAACGGSDTTLPTKPQSVQTTEESKPARIRWRHETPPIGRGHLPEGSIRASAEVATLRSILPATPWLELLEPDSRITATLARPIEGALHHRLHGVLREGVSWPVSEPYANPCPPVGPRTCFGFPWGQAYVRTVGRALTVDLITHGTATERAVMAATKSISSPSAVPQLSGDVVLYAENAKLTTALAQRHIPAFDHASIEFIQDEQQLRARLRWAPPTPWFPGTSDSSAPSWDALCSGALACARTGRWPDLYPWLQSLGTVQHPQDPQLLAASIWSGTWPHELAASVATLRNQAPEVSRAFIDVALSGLAEVEFAGARLDQGGVFIAFVRIPASWVNFTASVLPYAGLAPGPKPAGDTEITWAPVEHGGIALALDDGPDPRMGWIVFASSPERFAWLLETPRTRAQSSSLTARIARIGSVQKYVPRTWHSSLVPYADRRATLWVEVEQGQLSVSADLETP
ncbi:MAG: hypothetical protein KUG77_27140 [Nannocystaceae bacterium]|nr:hypothetical protein [Nannocystaceae bacterium]